MPFEEKDPKTHAPKIGLQKKIGNKKSIFDNMPPKPPTQKEFQKQVDRVVERKGGYNTRAAELFIQFQKSIADKTLAQNRNVFSMEAEREMLQNMVRLAQEVNTDPNENEEMDMGTLTLTICLLKTCLSQRDRINELEYGIVSLQKKMDNNLEEYIQREIKKYMDEQKTSNNSSTLDSKPNGG